MIRYGYNRQVNPPAPFAHVTLAPPGGPRDGTEWPAQLDTGADRTVVPERATTQLGLVLFGETIVAGLGSEEVTLPTVLVQVGIRQMAAVTIEALVCPGEQYVLLGRDILNRYRIVLDGPRLALEIE